MVVTIKIILITCEHGDHLDPKAISVVEKEGMLLITNASSREKLGKGQVMKTGIVSNLMDFIKSDHSFYITSNRNLNEGLFTISLAAFPA